MPPSNFLYNGFSGRIFGSWYTYVTLHHQDDVMSIVDCIALAIALTSSPNLRSCRDLTALALILAEALIQYWSV